MIHARILVVDDDRSTREVIARFLSRDGYEVDTADDGPTALWRIAETPYDLAVLDHQMPGMTGVETFRQARQLRPDLRGVFVTAYANINTVFPAIDAGVERVLSKPPDFDELRMLVAELLADGARPDDAIHDGEGQ